MKGSVAINLLLTLVLAALIGLHWVILPDPSLRNYEIMPDMVHSLALDAQAATAPLAGSKQVDLRPPEGAIARGYMPFEYPATPAGALEAGAELFSPISPDDPDAAARGAEIFTNFCAVCHGAGGHGDGNVTKRGVPPPPSLLAEKAVNMPDGQMYHLLTVGQGNMASYASQVNREDRWLAIGHIRALQEAARQAAAKAAAESAGAPTTAPATDVDAEPGRATDPGAAGEH